MQMYGTSYALPREREQTGLLKSLSLRTNVPTGIEESGSALPVLISTFSPATILSPLQRTEECQTRRQPLQKAKTSSYET